jgi:phenylalanyl-tRNA synthetase alpha chain
MLANLKQFKEKVLTELEAGVASLEDLEGLKKKYFGRKGLFNDMIRGVRELAEEERREVGSFANALKQELEERFFIVANTLRSLSGETRKEIFDRTLPGIRSSLGTTHPITAMKFRIWGVFQNLNFQVVDGPEIETDYYNFEALNIPPEHPARDMHDTFFLGPPYLLRTHTSNVQIHVMRAGKPPFRILTVGRTYRRDSDMRHSPMFHQFEGLMIDRDITMAHLKKLLQIALSEIFEKEVKVRFRISYFPFVEPGAEFDVTCTLCEGKGCATCKHTGWLELGGCGMVHEKVLENVSVDPAQWQGFAFGFGVERPLMIKYRINDIRLLFENDVRFLRQF